MSVSSHSAFSPIRLNVPAAPTEAPARPPLTTTELHRRASPALPIINEAAPVCLVTSSATRFT